ncbi:anti-sigma factor family protein [Tautonia rosea]|uniref:anti-sigma factor family protein n=1 Tax=Tautonia rosea TaxID=2728037 RepID=UPI0014740D0B|nr:hypothetical protein [Tautonia rosea]
MPTIDDTLIHAYVDGELDPESRLLVEQAAQADPRVARELGELARLHGLMSNVHRPPDLPDVSGEVVAHIQRADARRRALQPIASSTILALAALLMVTLFWNRPVPWGGQGQHVVVMVPANEQGEAVDPGAIAPAEQEAALVAESNGAASEPSETEVPSEAPEVVVAEATEAIPDDQAAFLLDLVDLDRSRTIVIEPVAGVSAEEVAEELNLLLRDTLRTDPRYGHLTESGDAPADLFLLVANPTEQTNLINRLEESLGDRCRVVEPAEADASPSLLFGDAGRLVLKSVEEAAPLRSSQERLLANRGHDHDPEATVSDPRVMVPPQRHGVPSLPPMPGRSPEVVQESEGDDGPPGVMVFWVRPSR